MKKFMVRHLVFCGLLSAMFFALSFVSLSLGSIKISVSAFPVLVGAALFGPGAGFSIGLVGAFLEQLVRYGITVTTPLWVLPAACRGLIVGFYCARKHFSPAPKRLLAVTVLSSLVTTVLNTAVMYIDSRIFGYYSAVYVFGALLPRFVIGAVTGVVFALLLPPLLRLIRKNFLL